MRRLLIRLATQVTSWNPVRRSRPHNALHEAQLSHSIDATGYSDSNQRGCAFISQDDHRDRAYQPPYRDAGAQPQLSPCLRYRPTGQGRDRTGPAADLTFRSLLVECRIRATPSLDAVWQLRRQSASAADGLTVERIRQREVNQHSAHSWVEVNLKT